MDLGKFEHWGVIVRPGETVNCDPGDIYCHISQIALEAGKGNEDVRVFVRVAGQQVLLSTLSDDRYPQHTTDLVFDKEFELLHSSETSSISVIGYKFSGLEKRSCTSTVGGDDSDDEVPLAIPLYCNADGKETSGSEDKAARPGGTATQSSKPKATMKETKNTGNSKADAGGNDGDDPEESESDDDDVSDSSDEDDRENSDKCDDETDFPEKAKAKNKPSAETPLKTPPVKKAKVVTPSMNHKPDCGSAKRSGYIHVATPFPSKHVTRAPSNRRKL